MHCVPTVISAILEVQGKMWGTTGKNTVNWGGLIMVLKAVFEYAEGRGKHDC